MWDANAAFWDARMREGNEFHRQLLMPVLEPLLGLRRGERVLEIACGNGQLARWMASRGVAVVATDVSPQMLAHARRRTVGRPGAIEYRVVDATDSRALERLGENEFDAAVCNMALMDMPKIDPLARALPRLLGPHGRFVFSVTHPCFNRGDADRVARWSDRDGVVTETVGVEVRTYLTPRTVRGLAMLGQPEAQPYFERPISRLLAPFLRAGLRLDRLEEPGFPPPDARAAGPWFSWSASLRELPAALVVRLVPARDEPAVLTSRPRTRRRPGAS